jgi:hypothetical protein
MKAMDSSDPTTALDWMAEDVTYHLALPGGAVTGSSKADFVRYIAGRHPVERLHHIVRHQTDGETEFVVGAVAERGEFTGSFLSAAVLTADGKIRRYESFFTPSFQLHPWPAADGGTGH